MIKFDKHINSIKWVIKNNADKRLIKFQIERMKSLIENEEDELYVKEQEEKWIKN